MTKKEKKGVTPYILASDSKKPLYLHAFFTNFEDITLTEIEFADLVCADLATESGLWMTRYEKCKWAVVVSPTEKVEEFDIHIYVCSNPESYMWCIKPTMSAMIACHLKDMMSLQLIQFKIQSDYSSVNLSLGNLSAGLSDILDEMFDIRIDSDCVEPEECNG